MYPNPQDVLPLPPHPDLEQYRKRTKDLVKACRSGEEHAYHDWAARWVRDLYALQPEDVRAREGASVERRIEQIATFARDRLANAACALTQAQFVVARAHGFPSWPKLVQHLESLALPATAVSAFERAADAITSGDLATLDTLLAARPQLARERSTREHHATLLHYVSANGVENYRQRSPANIVEIARVLLDAGAEVDAEADVYGGGATTLGLVVTSSPPRNAGVQLPLADLLIARGARIQRGIVRDCLMNGCPEAAVHLMGRGATVVTLEEAAGVGRVDLVTQLLEQSGIPQKELTDTLLMAIWYEHADIVQLLLDHGVDASRPGDEGQTALHIAAYLGNPQLVNILVLRGVPVNIADNQYRTPPFVWALHALLVEKRRPEERYRDVLTSLAHAGAAIDPAWLDAEQLAAAPAWLADLMRTASQ